MDRGAGVGARFNACAGRRQLSAIGARKFGSQTRSKRAGGHGFGPSQLHRRFFFNRERTGMPLSNAGVGIASLRMTGLSRCLEWLLAGQPDGFVEESVRTEPGTG